MENMERTKAKNFIRFYNDEEIQSMNFLFGKNDSNNWFTQEELAFACDVDLLNKENLEDARSNWLSISFE
ncbi:MAG: hypothetical protein IJ629_04295 [Clostridia bacterium]|nr:hypothetical protein [Clostridia bacterium]